MNVLLTFSQFHRSFSKENELVIPLISSNNWREKLQKDSGGNAQEKDDDLSKQAIQEIIKGIYLVHAKKT